jgi:hypothetical protein
LRAAYRAIAGSEFIKTQMRQATKLLPEVDKKEVNKKAGHEAV